MSVTNFIKSVKKGNLDMVPHHYAKCPRNISHQEVTGKSLYHLAIQQHHLPLLQLIYQLTALDPDVFDRDGQVNAISACIIHDFPEGLQFLVSKGANINAHNIEGYTPVMLAAGWGKPTDLAALIEYGAKLDFKVGRWQAVHLAAMSAREDNALFILQNTKVQWDIASLMELADQHKLVRLKEILHRKEQPSSSWGKALAGMAVGAAGVAGIGMWAASSGMLEGYF